MSNPSVSHNGISIRHWAMNLFSDPVSAMWLYLDPNRFASLYALIQPYVSLPDSLIQAAGLNDDSASDITINPKEFSEWRKSEEMPLRGKASPAYIRAFWEGTRLARVAEKSPALWEETLVQWSALLPTDNCGFEVALSEQVKKLVEAPSLFEVEPERLGAKPDALFHMNLGLFCAVSDIHFASRDLPVLDFAFSLTEHEPLRVFFEILTSNIHVYNKMMPVMLNIDKDDLDAATSEESHLAALGLVSFDPTSRRILPMNEFWHNWFGSMFRSTVDAMERFLVPLADSRDAGALARLSPQDTETVGHLLSNSDGLLGTNVLLYGPRSIDKLGWVRELAISKKCPSYTLSPSLPSAVRPSVCYVAQRILSRREPNAWLVLPGADGILTRTQRGRHSFMFMDIEFDSSVEDSAHEKRLLSDNPVPTVWLVNSTENLSENNIGRFLYTAELKAASRAERKFEISTILAPLNLSEDFIGELSQHVRIGQQQLHSAVNLVQRFESPASGNVIEFKEELVRRAIDQSQKALNRRQREDLRKSITEYSLDYLNIKSTLNVPQIIESMRRRPNASLCLYGLPGTGKTQLAEHIAVQLDKPILIKRASDLLGKFVGENEKNIKAMFDEAKEEDAVLLLDEADSFLRDRSLARQSWEVSTVNELLQGMERHNGIFICTTNLFSHLDLASLRRFTFKLEFLELDENQRWRMFLGEGGFKESDFTETDAERIKMDLVLIRGLAPGDFATIQRQINILDQKLDPRQWVNALEAEARAKMRDVSFNLGLATQTV